MRLGVDAQYPSPKITLPGRPRAMSPDIVIGDPAIIVECDGWYWHRNAQERDTETSRLLEEQGWRVIRIRQGLGKVGPLDIEVSKNAGAPEILVALRATLVSLNAVGVVDPKLHPIVERTSPADRISVVAPENSFAAMSPELLGEWDFETNDIDPTRIARFSRYVATWNCSRCGVKWMRSLAERSETLMCPTCSRSDIDQSRSLGHLFPETAKLWSTRNSLSQFEISSLSPAVVWWRCPSCPNEFQTSVHSKVQSGLNCPTCSATTFSPRKPRRGASVADRMEGVIPRWSANNMIEPHSLSSGSEQKTLWICTTCNTEFSIRTNAIFRGNGHDACGRISSARSRRTPKPGLSLADQHPTSIGQWSDENDRLPTEVNPGSGFSAAWICNAGHRFQRRVVDHKNRDFVCPKCVDRRRRNTPDVEAQRHPALEVRYMSIDPA